jgi:hypothetical protein
MAGLLSYFEHLHTDATLARAISTMVNHFLEDTIPPPIHEIAPNASTSLIKAFEDQETLGWDQWFCGRTSITWGEIYNHDIETKKNTKRMADKWGSDIVTLTWEFILSSWFARNETEHNKNNNPILQAKTKLVEQIEWIKTKIGNFQSNPYETTTQEELMDLPIDNLHMILDNILSLQGRKQRTK